MKVKNHKDFSYFDYVSESCSRHELGDVVLKETVENTQAVIEIGVIIQVHWEDEYRVDMWGNCCINEIRLATRAEIEKYRPDLLNAM